MPIVGKEMSNDQVWGGMKRGRVFLLIWLLQSLVFGLIMPYNHVIFSMMKEALKIYVI